MPTTTYDEVPSPAIAVPCIEPELVISQPNSLLTAALDYAARGWRVFPLYEPRSNGVCSCGKPECLSAGKHPRTPRGLKDGTINREKIREWWSVWPEANIGIATGTVSALVVFDVDRPELLTDWQGATLAVRTGKGRHFYFRLDSDARARSSAGKLGTGLDVRGDGAYVVAPPSRHASGATYEWINPDSELQIAPAWLLSSAPIPKGTRNRTLFEMGSAARGNGKENREILTELRLINSRRCAPPLCDQELQRIVDSVTRYPMGRESYHPNTTSPEVAADIGSETGTIKINEVEQVVLKHYPVLLPSVKCALAVFGTMPLAGRTKPLCMIFETTSGYGKSAVIQMCFAIGGLGLEAYVYRCDNFTPKTFVTHAANISQEKLAEIDLLPRLKDKVLVTKELSPIFRGREDHLKDTFAILIPVLDGKGFTSNSGVQGKRGYENEIIFNWIGATTPLPSETHRLMYQLGTRLLFFEVPAVTPDIAELLDYAKRDDASTGEAECQLVTNRFLVKLFERNPVGSVAPESITIPDEQLIAITRWSLFVATGRREIHCEKMNGTWVPVSAAKCEGPYKIVNYLKELARGHALIHDRTQVIGEDVELVAHVAISSLPDHLRPIVRALRETGEIDSTKCERLCNVSRPTARRYLLEASIVGLGNLKKGDPADNSPDNLILAPDFGWMRLP